MQIFSRALSLGEAPRTASVTSACQSTADGTFAVASGAVLRVYAGACGILLHEFPTLHARVLAVHYTSLPDCLVTLESDGQDLLDAEIYLCVYHDWRQRQRVRGYTLPLGSLESPTAERLANRVAVCSTTGRVVVATGSSLNVWQCSRGFFEHVLELTVDLTQRSAYHQIEFVAIDGSYLAYGSSTEVRVLEIHVTTTESAKANYSSVETEEQEEDGMQLRTRADLYKIPEVRIPSANFEGAEEDPVTNDRDVFEEEDQVPLVLGRDEAQEEQEILAGLLRPTDVRVNQAQGYHVSSDGMRMLLRRFVPPNQRLQSLRFLPETVEGAKGHARLLVQSRCHAFVYFFLSAEADLTRKHMARKVLGRGDGSWAEKLQWSVQPRRETSRVVVQYSFKSSATSVAANSSFLFVATRKELQIWTIWSPCQYLATRKVFSESQVPQPSQPQLLSVVPLPYAAKSMAALDSYLILLPPHREEMVRMSDFYVRSESEAAVDLLPENEIDLRTQVEPKRHKGAMLVLQQNAPSAIFQNVRTAIASLETVGQSHIDVLLSLFSLYRFRADATFQRSKKKSLNDQERVALQVETRQYGKLARASAGVLAHLFVSSEQVNLSRAAHLFVVSDVPSETAVQTLEDVEGVDEVDVQKGVQTYLEAFALAPNAVVTDDSFRTKVLEHYKALGSSDLASLMLQSRLDWSPSDLEFAFQALEGDVFVVEAARLVLLVQGLESTASGAFIDECSRDKVSSQLDLLLERGREETIELCVKHPELLESTDGKGVSVLATVLLDSQPSVLLQVLQKLFGTNVKQQRGLQPTLLYCLQLLGSTAADSVQRISHWMNDKDAVVEAALDGFKDQDLALLSFLLYVLGERSHVQELVDTSQIPDEDEDVTMLYQAVATETLLIGMALSHHRDCQDETITHLLPSSTDVEEQPAWVQQLLSTQEPANLHPLFTRMLQLMQHHGNVLPQPLINVYEKGSSSPFSTLVALLSFPMLSRTQDALRLLYTRQDLKKLLLPYGKHFCSTLDEWRLLLEMLADDDRDEEQVLDQVLTYICSTLGPEELVQVLPEDGDLGRYMETLELNVRLQKAHDSRRSRQPMHSFRQPLVIP